MSEPISKATYVPRHRWQGESFGDGEGDWRCPCGVCCDHETPCGRHGGCKYRFAHRFRHGGGLHRLWLWWWGRTMWPWRWICWLNKGVHERWGNGRIDYCLYCGKAMTAVIPKGSYQPSTDDNQEGTP